MTRFGLYFSHTNIERMTEQIVFMMTTCSSEMAGVTMPKQVRETTAAATDFQERKKVEIKKGKKT
jgi:hypothetical protein